MSSYTTQVRTLIEHYTQETPDIPLQEKIEKGREKFFDFDYPFFDEDYKEIFETNFLKYFYMYEIGQETEGLFKFRLDTWLNTNMFYYNKLFESEQLDYNPIENVNVSRKRKRNNNVMESDITARKGNANTKSNSKSDSSEKQNSTQTESQSEAQKNKQNDESFVRDIQSDTPESRLQITTGAKGTGVIEYASGIGENKSSGNLESESDTNSNKKGESTGNRSGQSVGESDATSSMTNEENRDKTLSECETETDTQVGKIGSATYQEMILQYRKTFVNVERQIFENMRRDGLFMLIYN